MFTQTVSHDVYQLTTGDTTVIFVIIIGAALREKHEEDTDGKHH